MEQNKQYGNLPTVKTAWRSPSNIALVKYWGKRPGNLPLTPSLSMTLQNSYTECEIHAVPGHIQGESVPFNLFFHEQPAGETFRHKTEAFLERLKPVVPFLPSYHLDIKTSNTFPHSSGIASSASSMSAIALCICSLENKVLKEIPGDGFTSRASYLSRLGSGSASRSVYGGYVVWGKTDCHATSTDELAVPLSESVNPVFNEWGDAILIVDSSRKEISSSAGHALMDHHFYAQGRIIQANTHFCMLIEALKKGDTTTFVRVVENEALSLHGLMLSSDPSYILLRENSISIIRMIRKFREQTGIPVCFTIDAGPNVHLLYPLSERDAVLSFVRNDLLDYCEGEEWIDDRMGTGPIELI